MNANPIREGVSSSKAGSIVGKSMINNFFRISNPVITIILKVSNTISSSVIHYGEMKNLVFASPSLSQLIRDLSFQ